MKFPWGIDLKDVIIFLVGIPVAFGISWFFFRRGLQRKQLIYSMRVEDILFRKADFPKELEVTYMGKPINVLTKARIYIWNGGNTPIHAADLDTSDALRITWPDEFEIFQSTVAYQSRETNKVHLVDDLLVEFSYLNVHDGALIEFIGTRKSDQPMQRSSEFGAVTGEVVGAEKQPIRQDYDFAVDRLHWPFAIVGGGGASLLVSSMLSKGQQYFVEGDYWQLPFIVLGGLFVFVLGALGVVGLVSWLTVHRLPRNLAIMGHNKRSLTLSVLRDILKSTAVDRDEAARKPGS